MPGAVFFVGFNGIEVVLVGGWLREDCVELFPSCLYGIGEFGIMEIQFGVLLATPGVRIRGAPPAAAVRSPCSWLIAGWSCVRDC